MDLQALDELMLVPSKAKTFFLLFLSIIFIIIGVIAIKVGEEGGWVVAGFFGLCIPLLFLRLVPGIFYLHLTKTSFKVKTLFKTEQFNWFDVKSFAVATIGRQTRVIFDFSEEYSKHSLGRVVSKLIVGTEGVLPETYGLEPGELAILMNQWKEKERNSCL